MLRSNDLQKLSTNNFKISSRMQHTVQRSKSRIHQIAFPKDLFCIESLWRSGKIFRHVINKLNQDFIIFKTPPFILAVYIFWEDFRRSEFEKNTTQSTSYKLIIISMDLDNFWWPECHKHRIWFWLARIYQSYRRNLKSYPHAWKALHTSLLSDCTLFFT